MVRWAPDAAQRMRDAAYQLFAEDGFASVTAVQIARTVGVTERTFFRHFSTKEEVLFSEGNEIVADLVGAIRQAPSDASPKALLKAALLALAATFESNRDHHRLRASIIQSVPNLRERELLKHHNISLAIVDELVKRRVSTSRAASLAGVGMAVFEAAYASWVQDRSRTSLSHRIERTLTALQSDLAQD